MLIPRNANVMLVRIQPAGDLYVSFFSVFCILGSRIPTVVFDFSCPLRFCVNVISVILILQGPRHLYFVLKGGALPFLLQSYVVGIYSKPPCSLQGDGFCTYRKCCNKQN